MTVTDDRAAAALGEIPPPPPCPTWCETDHDTRDFRATVSWIRSHDVMRKAEVPRGHVAVWVTVVDRLLGGAWEQRDRPELAVSSNPGQYVRASAPDDVSALVALVSLISPEVAEMAQGAVPLLSSPAVTPAGEDQ